METEKRCRNCSSWVDGVCRNQWVVSKSKSPEGVCSFFDYNVEGEEEKEKIELFKETYIMIKDIIKKYLDTSEDNIKLISLWVLSTHFYELFETFPYLYFNAMRGSGKTRLLKIIAELGFEGSLLGSLSEAVLFRSGGKTLCIDELEGIRRKENNALREVLNAGYKKGLKVIRMKKEKSKDGESYEPEEFEVYGAKAMANISGLEEVLEDRCISIILEKSNNPLFTKLVEDFDTNPDFLCVKQKIDEDLCSLCSVVTKKNIIRGWNNYILKKYNKTTLNTDITYNNITTLTTPLFEKIDSANIEGRNLELFFPLFIIASILGDDVLKDMILIAENKTKEKREEQQTESKDIMLFEYVSQQEDNNFIPVSTITSGFRNFIGDDDQDDKWLNSKWLGRALKRLVLIKDKRRTSKGVEVILDKKKALEKYLMFAYNPKTSDQKPEVEVIKIK